MADYIYPHAANPWLTYFASMPTTFDEEDVTTTGTTAGGITDAYIGGGGDAGGPIPILPRDDERDDYVWPLDSTIGTLGGLDRLGGFKHEPETAALSMPNFSEIANTMLGREGATEAFAGGAGNVGSRAGLYPDEVANLNTVMQGGYLNANNTGQDIFGVNIVSAGGDYAKRQQEIKDYYDSKSEEELEILMRSKYQRGRRNNANNVVNANSAIVAAEKAATGFITKKDEKEEDKRKTIVDAASYLDKYKNIDPVKDAGGEKEWGDWVGQPTTDPLDNIPIEYASYDSDPVKDAGGEKEWGDWVGGESESSNEPPSSPSDSGSPSDPMDSGMDNFDWGEWAKGGLIRKKYGNGGIVDLL